MRVTLIVATDKNGLIGRGGELPWRLPADLAYFKRVTLGHPIIMGRKTHDSIGRPLPGRTNIVLTRQDDYEAPGCTVVRSIEEALAAAGDANEVLVIGGAAIYEAFLPRADRILKTEIDAEFEGDTWFPRIDPRAWIETRREPHPADAENPWDHAFVVLDRKVQTVD